MQVKAPVDFCGNNGGMQGTALLVSMPGSMPARPRAGAIFLPKEHGSWSLALEPLALGLLVAPSFAGGAFTVVALAGFFARRPFKTLVAPGATRRPGSRNAVWIFSILGMVGLALVVVLAGITPLWPLLLAAPLGGVFAWFDAQNGSRASAAEVAGSATFALLPAALATLAGWSAGPALALAALALARNVPTVLTVRSALRRAKGEAGGFGFPLIASLGAALGLTVLGARGFLPPWAVLPAWVLLARTLWFASRWRPSWSARRVGMLEAVLGLGYLITITVVYLR